MCISSPLFLHILYHFVCRNGIGCGQGKAKFRNFYDLRYVWYTKQPETIDADDNTISDLTTSNFKSGTIVTSVSSSSTNGEIPTALAVNTAIGDAILNKNYTENNSALTASSGLCTWTVTHNLNRSDVDVAIYEVSGGEKVMFDCAITSANVVTIKILSASNIAANTYKVVIVG